MKISRLRSGRSGLFVLLLFMAVGVLVFGEFGNVSVQVYFVDKTETELPTSVEPSSFTQSQSSSNLKNLSGFAQHILALPWDSLEKSTRSQNYPEISTFYEAAFRHLLPYLVKPPPVQINTTCSPPPSTVYNCTPPAKPPKIGILLEFGFEADVLEIHFREVCDLVEYIFILESPRGYFRGLAKPLLWPILRKQERFEFCKEKVVHFVMDDSDYEKLEEFVFEIGNRNYNLDELQDKRRWEKFVEWNKLAKVFGDGDWLGFGDSDEIPARRNVEYLKHCEHPADMVDIGIWFPYGRINQAYRTDWSVSGHPLTFGDPTFWKFQAAMVSKSYPTKRRGRSGSYLLGGAHFTWYGYLPFILVKMMSTVEQDEFDFGKINLSKRLREESILDLENDLTQAPPHSKGRFISVEDWKQEDEEEFKEVAVLPWFYDCNRDRYPMWEGSHDSRID